MQIEYFIWIKIEVLLQIVTMKVRTLLYRKLY